MNARVWIRSALALLILFLIFLPLLSSQVIKYSLTSELENRGMSDVSVEKLWLNPYTGVASIKALKFSQGEDLYHLNNLELDLALTALWQRKVRVKGIRLVSANLVVQQDEEGNFIINGISLAGDSTQEVVEEVVEEDLPEDDSAAWQFALDSLGVEDVQVLVDLPNVLADVDVHKIVVAKLDTGMEHQGSAEVSLTLNKLALPSEELKASLAFELKTKLALERLGLDDWKLTSQANTTLSDLHLTAPQGEVKLPATHLELDTQAQYNDENWTLKATTETTLSGVDVNTPDAVIKLPAGIIELTVDAASQAADKTLTAQAKVDLSDLDVDTPDAKITLPQTVLGLTAEASASGENQKASVKGTLALSDLDVEAADSLIALPRLSVDLDAKGHKEEAGWALAGTSNIGWSKLDVISPQAVLQWTQADMTISSEASLGDAVSYQAAIDLSADDGAVQTGAHSEGLKQAPLATLKKLTLSSAIIGDSNNPSANQATVKQLLLSGLDLLPSDAQPTLISDAEFSLSGMTVKLPTDNSAMDVVVDKVALPKAAITFIRDAEGNMPQLAAVLPSAPENKEPGNKGPGKNESEKTESENTKTEPSDQTAQASASSGTPVLIKHLSVGPDVAVAISDAGVKPPFEEKVRFKSLEIKNLSLADSSQAAHLSMNLLLSHDAAINAEGTFNAIAPRADVKINLNEYQLLSLSGYSEQFTGYALETGVFNLTSTVKVADNQLDTQNEAIINHVSLRPEHSDTAERFAHSLTMPLDQALDLLRDSNDQIKLQVPVKGALNDPDVDIQQIINKALGGAMKKASMLVLKTLLQPYGAIISVAQMAGEKMTEVKLDTVKFDTGSADLSAVAQDYAGKIGAMLKEREALTLKMCGVTNRQDLRVLVTAAGEPWPADESGQADTLTSGEQEVVSLEQKYKEPLKQLGNARTNNLKRYMQSSLNVKPSQLLVCLPKYQPGNTESGGVELSF